jgi:hypothetical protein
MIPITTAPLTPGAIRYHNIETAWSPNDSSQELQLSENEISRKLGIGPGRDGDEWGWLVEGPHMACAIIRRPTGWCISGPGKETLSEYLYHSA